MDGTCSRITRMPLRSVKRSWGQFPRLHQKRHGDRHIRGGCNGPANVLPVRRPRCHSGWGPDADRHAKLLIHFISEGAHFRAYSQWRLLLASRPTQRLFWNIQVPQERWRRLPKQIGGLAKVDSGRHDVHH